MQKYFISSFSIAIWGSNQTLPRLIVVLLLSAVAMLYHALLWSLGQEAHPPLVPLKSPFGHREVQFRVMQLQVGQCGHPLQKEHPCRDSSLLYTDTANKNWEENNTTQRTKTTNKQKNPAKILIFRVRKTFNQNQNLLQIRDNMGNTRASDSG